MKINVTVPKSYSYFYLVHKTRKFMKGDNKKAVHVFEGKDKKYYSYIQKQSVLIDIVENDPEIIEDIKKYLEYLFNEKYIGISFIGIDKIPLDNVECFYNM